MQMDFTGERYVPELRGQIYYEHLHRYMLAFGMSRDLDVLDIACGEGYGAAYLAIVARSVVGVDIDPQSIRHAGARYTGMNLSFRVGSCTDIPLADRSVDVVVSFETIEHIEQHERFLKEILRVLRPDGRLIISSPNKAVYSDRDRYQNPYHVRELYFDELRDLLCSWFSDVRLYGQRIVAVSAVHPLRGLAPDARFISPTVREAEHGLPALPEPAYFIAVCSRSDAGNLAKLDSMFIDPRDDLLAHIVHLEGTFREHLPARPGGAELPAAGAPTALPAAAQQRANGSVAAGPIPLVAELAAELEQRGAELAAEVERRNAERETLEGLLTAVLGPERAQEDPVAAAGRAHDRLHALYLALDHHQHRVGELETRAAADQQRYDDAAAQLAEATAQRDGERETLAGLIAAILGSDRGNDELVAAAGRAHDRFYALTEALEQSRGRVADLEARVADYDARVAESQQLHEALAAAQRRIDEVSADQQRAAARIAALEAQRKVAVAGAESARAKTAETEARLASAAAQHADDVAALAREADAQRKALQSRVDAFATALAEGIERLDAESALRDELSHALGEARAELNAARADLASTAAELDRVRNALAAIVESTSWRMTRPLRVTMRALRGE
jgi:SAM-dependent methyltransferase